ncbi:hypothetical protein GW17_00039816, partial [Ensete ventricosum]
KSNTELLSSVRAEQPKHHDTGDLRSVSPPTPSSAQPRGFPPSSRMQTLTVDGLRLPHPAAASRRRPALCRRARPSFVRASVAAVAPRRETDPKKRVVITGMGLVSVFGNDVDAYYEKLLEGESGIGYIDRFDASTFPTNFAAQIREFSSEGYIDAKVDRRLDNCPKYTLVSGKKALESAGLGVGSRALAKVCFFFPHFTIK